MPGGRFVIRCALSVAVEVDRVLFRRKPVEDRSFGVSGELLDHLGYRVTVVESEAFELCLGLNADEELDTLLAAVDAEMALAIALLLLGRGQSHDDASPRGYSVPTTFGYTVTEVENDVGAKQITYHHPIFWCRIKERRSGAMEVLRGARNSRTSINFGAGHRAHPAYSRVSDAFADRVLGAGSSSGAGEVFSGRTKRGQKFNRTPKG